MLNPATRSTVHASTVKAVAKAAAELGYRRHAFATALRTGRSDMIGVLVPDITNPLFPPIIRGIESELEALGCYRALAERGLKCPDEISVTGFNDMPLVDKLTPPLTTVHIPRFEMGRYAARLLLDQIRNPDLATQTVVLKCDIVKRGSAGPVRV